VLLAAISESPSAAADRTFVQALGGQPISLDPAKSNRIHDDQVMWFLYDALLQYSADGKNLLPALAERWAQSADGLTTTFVLRKDVRFHDGSILDAQAVKASYERQYLPSSPFYTSTPANAYERVLGGFVKEVRVLDSHSVAITTHYARPHQFAISKIVSPKALSTHKGDLSRAPSGTGPFRLDAWDRNQIALAAFPDSWHGRPKVAGIRTLVIGSDIELMDRLAAGDFDLVINVTPDRLEELAASPRVALVRFGGLNTMMLGMMMDRPLIQDRRVREAVVRAVDRERLARFLGRGMATTAMSVLPPNCAGFDSTVSQPAYDPERARALLKDVGATTKPTLRLLHHSPSELWEEIVRAVESDLSKVGFDVALAKTATWADFHKERAKGDHDLHLRQWQISAPDPESFLAPLFQSKSNDNFGRFANPRVDELLAEARKPMDSAQRLAVYGQVNKLITDDNAALFLLHRIGIAGANKRVQGLTLNLYGLPQDKLVNVEIR
jgi:peptide/nickel transport system substrate-binding protein